MKRFLQYKVFTLLMLAAFCCQHVSFAAAVHPGPQASLIKKESKAPHMELKLVQNQFNTATGQSVHKFGGPGYLTAAPLYRFFSKISAADKSAYTLLLVKDYLFFIYPSHHFW
jgi:hypothetical protein